MVKDEAIFLRFGTKLYLTKFLNLNPLAKGAAQDCLDFRFKIQNHKCQGNAGKTDGLVLQEN